MNPESLALALLGGGLIGLSASLLMYLNGRIAGICGILAAAVLPGEARRAWRWMFLAGLPSGVFIWHALSGLPVPSPAAGSPWLVLAAGFIVGVGTRVGSGCTSGHGVCGLARLSLRSLVATLLFMSAGAVTVAVMRHGAGG